MSEMTREQQRVLTEFMEVWGDKYLADDLGAKITCSEADSIEALFNAFGNGDAGKAWADAHALSDDPGDEHARLAFGTKVRIVETGVAGVVVDASDGFVVEPGEIWVKQPDREFPQPFDFDELEVIA